MKTLEKLSKWIAVVLFLLIAVTLAIFLFDFYSIITKSTRTASEEHLIENTRTSATMINEAIRSDLNTVYALSSMIGSFEPIDSPEAKALLNKVGKDFSFSALIVSMPDDSYYTNNDTKINLRNPQYLIGSNVGDKSITKIYVNALNGQDMIALESPIYQNGTRVGEVSGLYDTDYINTILSITANGNGHQYQIIDRNGNFILPSGLSEFYKYHDFYSFLHDVKFSEGDKADMVIHDFVNGKPGAASYGLNGRPSYLCYVPIGFNEWYLVSTAPELGVNLQMMTLENPTVMLAVRIIGLFILLIVYIIWRQVRYRISMEGSRKELEILNEKLQVKNESLKLKAENDLLTGLYNKVTSELAIKEYLLNEGKEGRHALLIVDVDDFKRINDEFGHFVGDKALIEVADVIDHCLRTTDLKGRIGGDEFIALLKNVKSKKDLKQKAEEICSQIKRITLSEDLHLKVSASAGAAIYPDHAGDFTDLFRKADSAMYYSKETGKGTYNIYEKNTEN